MQKERNRSPEQVAAAIMSLLLDAPFDLSAIVEIEREIGDPVAVRDGLNRLRGAGLIYELENMMFVMATRAARLAAELPQS